MLIGGDCAMQSINNTDCFGIVVKSTRQERGMTQSQLAIRLSITTRYLKQIGKRHNRNNAKPILFYRIMEPQLNNTPCLILLNALPRLRIFIE